MVEAGSGFCFATESLQMCLRGPMSQTDYFESYGAVETFLPGAINYALSTTTDLLEQFVVTKVGKRLCRTWCFLFIWCSLAILAAGVDDPGYRFVREQIKPGLEEASGAKSFRCVGENLPSALSTKSKYAAHYGRVLHPLPSCTARNSITRYARNTAIK